MNLDRFELLIGKENLETIRKLNILIIGVGGVGGYVLEGLVRSGVENITVVDNDSIDASNLNRQLITNSCNIGKLKVEEAKKRSLIINSNVKIEKIPVFLDESNIENIVKSSFDYVVDACDSVKTKVYLIKHCVKNGIKIISSMGTANKLDASKLCISTLNKTSYCVLAKKIRTMLSIEEMKKTIVVFSTEECKKIDSLGTTSYLPGIAGLLIVNKIVQSSITQ